MLTLKPGEFNRLYELAVGCFSCRDSRGAWTAHKDCAMTDDTSFLPRVYRVKEFDGEREVSRA